MAANLIKAHRSHIYTKCAVALAVALASAPLVAQPTGNPFGRHPSDPVSSFAMRDKAGNVQLRMVRPASTALASIEGERCMPKTTLCFSINEADEKDRPMLRIRVSGFGTDISVPLDASDAFGPNPSNNSRDLALTPLAIRMAPAGASDAQGERMIIGIEARESLAYSGGAAHRTVLLLYQIDEAGTTDAVARQVLSVPLNAEQAIRACFSEKDEKARNNACLDETSVEAMLVLDPDNSDIMPRLIYNVGTTSYPSDVPFREYEHKPKALTEADLVRVRHPVCTYQRKLAWNPATARFEFDRPAPACNVFGLARR